MKTFTQLLNFYINSSIHVALSCYALVRITYHMFGLQNNQNMALFVFFGTIVGYNFVKYDALVRVQKIVLRIQLKFIAILSFISLLLGSYYFLQIEPITQTISIGIVALTMLYTLPFFPNKQNARNWAGVKIYIVSLCWMGATLFLPIINAKIPITVDFYLKCIQRFILVFVLILIFEIIDLANDDPHLQTVPQKIGIKKTKALGLLLLFPFYFLEFFKTHFGSNQLTINWIMIIVLALFIVFANRDRNKYYSSFWAESIPVFWWLLVVISS